jgi:mannose-1-phosphate guanylyltransferase
LRALLLAAGFGTRLRPITDHVPKCLVEIDEKPLLSYWLDQLSSKSIDKVLVNTHYLPVVVEEFIQTSKYQSKIQIAFEKSLLGTGGTILKNRGFFNEQSFFVAHADNLTLFDLDNFIEAHHNRPKSTEITMMVFDTDAPQTCGIVETDENGLVLRFHEKVKNPPGKKANAAVYIFEPTIFNFLEELGKEIIDLSTEVLPFFMEKIQIFHNSTYHRDIGNMESLGLANEEFPEIYKKYNLDKDQ